jgi:hypothetical protein
MSFGYRYPMGKRVTDCVWCDSDIFESEDWREDESGAYHNECAFEQMEKSQAEAGIPPHSYRVNVAYENEAYDRSNYKNTDYMEEVLDADG